MCCIRVYRNIPLRIFGDDRSTIDMNHGKRLKKYNPDNREIASMKIHSRQCTYLLRNKMTLSDDFTDEYNAFILRVNQK